MIEQINKIKLLIWENKAETEQGENNGKTMKEIVDSLAIKIYKAIENEEE